VITYTAAGFVAVILLISAAASGVIATLLGNTTAGSGCLVSTVTAPSPGTGVSTLTAEQTTNAATIIQVGQHLDMPVRAWVIAIAVALQESDLINLGNLGTGNDHDSLGLFQQRPSQGWGTPAQLTNPQYAAAAFYTALRKIPDWQTLPLTVAGQRVQKSASPGAHAAHETQATAIVAAFTGGTVCDGGDTGTGDSGGGLPAGFTLPADTPAPVVTAIMWALAQRGTPYVYGGDCTAPRSGDPDKACDCSSLVQRAYAAAGLSLPRTTGEQVHTGTPVTDMTDIRPGDIVFIPGSGGTITNPNHEALYIGTGLVVQAPHTGTVVSVQALTRMGQIAAIRRVVETSGPP
jgi:cell wall-associated NlpC family hydrolase